MHVLVVEDEPALRHALERALRGWGHSHAGVATGREALARWAPEQPDLVLLDLGLPDLDGLEVLHAARSASLTTSVLLLTAFFMLAATNLMQARALRYTVKS